MAVLSQCSPRIIAVDPSNGTVTRATIVGMTPTMFEDQGYKEVGMDKIYGRAKEARAAGYIEKGIEMLVNGVTTPMKHKMQQATLAPNPSVILPYFAKKQKTSINANWWRIYSSAAHPSAGSGSIHPGARRLTIRNTGSAYGSTLASIQRYFLPSKYLTAEHINSTTLAAYRAQFKIFASSNADSGGTAQAYVDVEPNVTAATWAGYTSDQKLPWQPSSGIATVLANSISDFESWGQNEAADNPWKMLIFWLQTCRFAHEYNDEYVRALEAALTSEYYKQFRQLPLAQQRVQQYGHYTKQKLNTFFYGQRIDENQTNSTYTSLPKVYDPEDPTLLLEYKSNTLGILTQLQDCSRYTDGLQLSFDLTNVFSTGYQVKRAREGAGMGDASEIDLMVPRDTSGKILEQMITFYKAKYGVNTERQYQANQELSNEKVVALRYNRYQLPDDFGGYYLNVFADDYFSDKIAAATPISTAAANRARSAWMLDWPDLALEIGASTSVTRETNIRDSLYRYVIKPNMRHVQLESETFAVTVGDANRSYVWENNSSTVVGPY